MPTPKTKAPAARKPLASAFTDTESALAIEKQPIDIHAEGYTEGVFVHRIDKDGAGKPLAMSLQIVEDDPLGKTHHLKSQDHYWEGTQEEFRNAFDRASRKEEKGAKDQTADAKAKIAAAKKAQEDADKAAEDQAEKEAADKAAADKAAGK